MLTKDKLESLSVQEINFISELSHALSISSSVNYDQAVIACVDLARDRVAAFAASESTSTQPCHLFYLSVLRCLKPHVRRDVFKYQTMEQFTSAYTIFSALDEQEKTKLIEFANWLAILLSFVPALKNKVRMVFIQSSYHSH